MAATRLIPITKEEAEFLLECFDICDDRKCTTPDPTNFGALREKLYGVRDSLEEVFCLHCQKVGTPDDYDIMPCGHCRLLGCSHCSASAK